MKLKTNKHFIAAFLDLPNYIGAVNHELHPINLNWIEEYLDELGTLLSKHAYVHENGWENSSYLTDFSDLGWEIIMRHDKEDIDIWLTADAIKLASFCKLRNELVIVIISGDSDYLYPLEHIVKMGYRAILLTTHEIKNHEGEGVEIIPLPNISKQQL